MYKNSFEKSVSSKIIEINKNKINLFLDILLNQAICLTSMFNLLGK